ncbi:MAG: hypothetical protein ABSC21_17530 [Terriglobia bacterium]|jgi:hypothetical protein
MRKGILILVVVILVGSMGGWIFRQHQIAEASAKAQIEAKDQVEYAACKQAEAEADAAHEASLRNDQVMDENEAYIGRTQGPAAEARQKAKDFPNRTNKLHDIIKDIPGLGSCDEAAANDKAREAQDLARLGGSWVRLAREKGLK